MESGYRIERWKGSGPPCAARLREQMASEGYSVFQWTDVPGAVYGEHLHAEDQSHWIVSGTLELTIDNAGTFRLEAGDRDFMPANTLHSARVPGDRPVVYLVGEMR